MDADLQDPPEIIPKLIECWLDGADIVHAVRRSRQETGIRRIGINLFHSLFVKLADHPMEANSGTFGLMDREAVNVLNSLPERNRFFPGLRTWVGFTTGEVLYDRHERAAKRKGLVEKPRRFPNYPDIGYQQNGAGHQYHGLTMQALRKQWKLGDRD